MGNGENVPTGGCTLGYDNGRPNGRVYRCIGTGQQWRECSSLAACRAGTECTR